MKSIQTATRAHYDRWSYDFETAEHTAMQLDESLLGRALGEVGPGDLVLDGGCGTGLVARLARGATKARAVVGLDLSLGSLRRAQRASAGVAFAQGDLLRLPMRSDTADLVVSRGVIMTTGNPAGALAELARVTRPGGRLYVRVYNHDNAYRIAYRIGGPICRAIAAVPGGTTALAILLVPPFYLLLQLAVLVLRQRFVRIGPRVLWNVFADQFLVPHNSFHTLDEVRAGGEANACRSIGEGTRRASGRSWPRASVWCTASASRASCTTSLCRARRCCPRCSASTPGSSWGSSW
jgi:SAM-dependent methyltransferase